MRAYRFSKLLSIDDLVLGEDTMPVPQRGEVLVRVHAAALNYRDLSVLLGNYVGPAKPGLVPCSDAAGVIEAVGEGVTAWKPGDRVLSVFHPRWFGGEQHATANQEVYGTAQDGWLCTHKVVSQEAVVTLPTELGFEQGATLPCAAVTAWTALAGPIPIRAGNTVLTLGTGGVSIFAVQLAKAVGANVISTTSSDAKRERLLALGAQTVLNYRSIPHWGQHVKRALTDGRGVDRVVEVVGPATINESLHAVRRGGEVVLIGFLSSDNPGIDYFHLKGTGASVRSITVGDRSALLEVLRVIVQHKIEPTVDRIFDFEEARNAFHRQQDAEHVGKIVIRVS